MLHSTEEEQHLDQCFSPNKILAFVANSLFKHRIDFDIFNNTVKLCQKKTDWIEMVFFSLSGKEQLQQSQMDQEQQVSSMIVDLNNFKMWWVFFFSLSWLLNDVQF